MALRRVCKPETVRSMGLIEVTSLVNRVRQLSEQTWSNEDARKENAYSVFHHTRHIIFRFIPGNRDPSVFYDTEAWPIWRPLLEPVMMRAVRDYGFERPVFPKVMLASLAAGAVIDPHSDGAGITPPHPQDPRAADHQPDRPFPDRRHLDPPRSWPSL